MASNTKLTTIEKQYLRDFKDNMTKNMAFGQYGRVTVLVQFTGNVVKFSTAVASPYEKKIRRKVGQFHAARRWRNNQFAVMPDYYTDLTVRGTAQFIAELFNFNQ